MGAEKHLNHTQATVGSVLPFKTPLPNANPIASLLDTGTFFAIDTSTRVSDLAPNAALHSVCQPLNGLGNDMLTSTSAYDAEFAIGDTKVTGRVLVCPKFSPPLPYDLLVGKTVYEKFGGFVCLDNDTVYVNGYSFLKQCAAKVEATGDPDVPLRYTYDVEKIPEAAAALFRQLPGALGLQRGAGDDTGRTPGHKMRRIDHPPSNIAPVCACSDSRLTWKHVAVMQKIAKLPPPTPRQLELEALDREESESKSPWRTLYSICRREAPPVLDTLTQTLQRLTRLLSDEQLAFVDDEDDVEDDDKEDKDRYLELHTDSALAHISRHTHIPVDTLRARLLDGHSTADPAALRKLQRSRRLHHAQAALRLTQAALHVVRAYDLYIETCHALRIAESLSAKPEGLPKLRREHKAASGTLRRADKRLRQQCKNEFPAETTAAIQSSLAEEQATAAAAAAKRPDSSKPASSSSATPPQPPPKEFRSDATEIHETVTRAWQQPRNQDDYFLQLAKAGESAPDYADREEATDEPRVAVTLKEMREHLFATTDFKKDPAQSSSTLTGDRVDAQVGKYLDAIVKDLHLPFTRLRPDTDIYIKLKVPPGTKPIVVRPYAITNPLRRQFAKRSWSV